MDFSNRNVQPQAAAPVTHHAPTGTPAPNKATAPHDADNWARIVTVLLAGAVVILLGAAVAFAASRNNNQIARSKVVVKTESSYVDAKKLQAVFLNTGQVYFGNVKILNDNYVVLSNIYYLQTSGTDAASTAKPILVKLGCELHQPDDQMVINRDQVTFWENLHDSGQVAQGVKLFKEKYPKGQQCVDQSTSSSSDSSSKVQSAAPNAAAKP